MTEKKKRGRPTLKDDPKVVEKIMKLAEEGKTQQEIADIIGISHKTLINWKTKDWEFSSSLKENKQLADEMVEASLYMRATGYTHPEEKIFCYEGEIIRAQTMKYYPPDSTAMIFWLKNRQPKKWMEAPIPADDDELRNMPDEELFKKAKNVLKFQAKK